MLVSNTSRISLLVSNKKGIQLEFIVVTKSRFSGVINFQLTIICNRTLCIIAYVYILAQSIFAHMQFRQKKKFKKLNYIIQHGKL